MTKSKIMKIYTIMLPYTKKTKTKIFKKKPVKSVASLELNIKFPIQTGR
jgi:hypothetical protein